MFASLRHLPDLPMPSQLPHSKMDPVDATYAPTTTDRFDERIGVQSHCVAQCVDHHRQSKHLRAAEVAQLGLPILVGALGSHDQASIHVHAKA
jgi:hypothetical protein